MQSIILIVCLGLGLLLYIEPAIAQKEYRLTVSAHEQVRPKLTEKIVNGILERASKLLTVRNQCGVTFKLNGPITSFAPGTPNIISSEDDLEAVHREAADVKVVSTITFCKKDGTFIGCAWRRYGPKTVIVTQRLLAVRHILWTHEFGHTTGLQHRADKGVLMTPCDLALSNVVINQDECNCFLAGQGGCQIPEPDPEVVCTENQKNLGRRAEK
jgi:hypothetical protein